MEEIVHDKPLIICISVLAILLGWLNMAAQNMKPGQPAFCTCIYSDKTDKNLLISILKVPVVTNDITKTTEMHI
jgi:hypothetical protein